MTTMSDFGNNITGELAPGFYTHDLIAAREARLKAALGKIEISAQAGLCYFTLESAREFLKDIRDEVADALGQERPGRSK